MGTFPPRIRGLGLFAFAWGLYAAVWVSLEGNLAQTVVLSLGLTLLLAAYGGQSWLGGKALGRTRWLLLGGVGGAAAGILTVLLTLFFMVIKTGLHAHGPEFSLEQFVWVAGQWPLWAAAGTLAGSGLGLLAGAWRS